MMLGVMSGNIDYMQPPEDFTNEHREILAHPGFQRMLKYAFIGDPETIKEKTETFLQETGVNEIMAVSHIYDHRDRLKSFEIFSDIMKRNI